MFGERFLLEFDRKWALEVSKIFNDFELFSNKIEAYEEIKRFSSIWSSSGLFFIVSS